MGQQPNLKTVSDHELRRRLTDFLRQTRRAEADLIAHMAEFDARRLYLHEAASSMFAWCTEVLHLSEHEAYLRITVARASREHPVLLAMLRDGRLHLSGVCKLAPHLTRDNRKELLERAAHRSKRQIEELVAALAPRPSAPTVVRKLPERRGGIVTAGVLEHGAGQARASDPVMGPGGERVVAAEVPRAGAPGSSGPLSGSPGSSCLGSGAPGSDSLGSGLIGAGPAPLVSGDAIATAAELGLDRVPENAHRAEPRPAVIEPVAPARFRIRFDASAGLRSKLERLQALMRSSVPDGDLARIIEEAVTEKLERVEAERFAKTRAPRKRISETKMTPTSRHIPAAVRRAVEKRDGSRCTFRDSRGKRCTRRHDLEFHHRVPFGLGGDHSPKNVCLMCRAHNNLLAEHDYGKEVMAQHRRSGSRVAGLAAVSATEPRIGPGPNP
jgi:hypothetical protein